MLKRTLATVFTLGIAVFAVSSSAQSQDKSNGPSPQFTTDGQLIAPKDYREWIFLSSGLGMTYGPLSAGATAENPRFENVFVNPLAYRSFLQTGTWPDGTIFILEIRSSASKLSINKDGRVQTDIAGIQAEVKDSKRFPKKWEFFNLSKNAPSTKIDSATCHACHGANGAVDNTFVQFYPTLIETAKAHGTFKGGE
jgi:Cytochrome P460